MLRAMGMVGSTVQEAGIPLTLLLVAEDLQPAGWERGHSVEEEWIKLEEEGVVACFRILQAAYHKALVKRES
jgi:hypothetical protein